MDKAFEQKILQTEDGFQTITSAEYGEKYHSIYGARTESEVVFINAGFKNKIQLDCIDILEMGFGTGLNALMTWIESEISNKQVNYTTYEKHPLSASMIPELQYGQALDKDSVFEQLHTCPWNHPTNIGTHFSLHKIQGDIHDISDIARYDVIYYDAFAPSAQADLWTEDIFGKMYQALKPDGILVTYCAKGQVKRNLKAVGFTIEALPGPPGKREMTRARK